MRSDLKKRLPKDDQIEKMQFGEIREYAKNNTIMAILALADGLRSLKQSLKDDVAFLKSSPYIREDLKPRVRGFLYDIKSGSMEEMEV